MKITFISNYLNHHQKSLCDSIYSKLNGNFNFISLDLIPLERLNLGYEDYSNVLYNRNYNKNFDVCKKLIHEADVLILGSKSIRFSLEYINTNKIIYFYSEHNLKKINLKANFFKLFLYSLLKFFLGFMKNTYILSASSHLPNEWQTKSFRNKIFIWGYFPYSNLKNRDSEIFANKIKELYHNKKMIKLISTRAFKTINNLWNPNNAAKRFVFTTFKLLKGQKHFYKKWTYE